jgi:hypothetical protein
VLSEGTRTVDASGGSLDLAGRLSGDLGALDDFARELEQRMGTGRPEGSAAGLLPRRINADGSTVEKDLAKLVLSIVDLVRQLMERAAIRRVNAGSLSDDVVERMGETFLKLDQRMTELRLAFGLEPEDLKLSLGHMQDLM